MWIINTPPLFPFLPSFQAGPELAERTTQTFMALLTRERMEEALSQESSNGGKVVEKYTFCVNACNSYWASCRTITLVSLWCHYDVIYYYVQVSPHPDITSSGPSWCWQGISSERDFVRNESDPPVGQRTAAEFWHLARPSRALLPAAPQQLEVGLVLVHVLIRFVCCISREGH